MIPDFYIARAPCGCCVASTYVGNRDVARTVAGWIRRGWTVHLVSREGWEAPLGCRCAPTQLTLPTEPGL
jgi:hypothetical protein